MREITYTLAKKLEKYFQEQIDFAQEQKTKAEDECDPREYNFWSGFEHAMLNVRTEIRKYED